MCIYGCTNVYGGLKSYTAFFFLLVQFRLVGKTALKLLLVFVEYTESNSRVLYDAIQTVDSNQGMEMIPWKTNSSRY